MIAWWAALLAFLLAEASGLSFGYWIGYRRAKAFATVDTVVFLAREGYVDLAQDYARVLDRVRLTLEQHEMDNRTEGKAKIDGR